METTAKYLSQEDLRNKASQKVFAMFNGALSISIKYFSTYALASCLHADGVKEYVMVDYDEFIPQGQHGIALEYIRQMGA